METMNKKGMIEILIIIGFVLAALVIWGIFVLLFREEIDGANKWNSFCDKRPAFCYCDTSNCNFRIEYNNNIPSKETKEYCELAKELNDKQALFNGRCNK